MYLQLLMKRKNLFILISFILITGGCNDEEFMFDIDNLTGTTWGVPMIIDGGAEFVDLSSPTIFRADGIAIFGTSRTDFWSIKGKRTLLLEQAGELWFIIDLSPQRLYVEKTKQANGAFIAKCLYEPLH